MKSMDEREKAKGDRERDQAEGLAVSLRKDESSIDSPIEFRTHTEYTESKQRIIKRSTNGSEYAP